MKAIDAIRGMYNYCKRHDLLSNDAEIAMSEYFEKVNRLKHGKKHTAAKRGKLVRKRKPGKVI